LAGDDGYDSSSRNTGWNHFLCSGNLATSTFHMFVNGSSVLDAGATVVVNDNIDFTGLFHVGRIGSDSTAFYGEMAEFWLDDSFIDFSSSTNREKFYSSGGAAVDLGSDGSTPTGSAPLVYLHLDSGETGNNFASNAGTGGDLTVTAGALVNAGGLTTIETVRRSTVYTWNSTISTTAQTIANQEASPADGSDQTDYDIMNGSSTGSDTRDVTYVSQSGGEYYKPASNTALDFLTMHTFKDLTTFTNSLHKEDAAFTIEMGFGAPNPPPTSNIGYFASTGEDSGDVGIAVKYDNNNKIVFAVSNGSGSSLALSQTSTNAAASGFNHVVISIDEGVTNGSIIYLNNSTSDTFSANYSSPSTSAATYNWHFLTSLQAPPGDLSTPRFAVGTNSGIGYFAVYNKAVSAEEAGILYDNAPSRFKV